MRPSLLPLGQRDCLGAGVGMRPQRGLTIIELLISLLIGLLTTLVVTQVLTSAEGIKRTTSSGTDAQVGGALALFTLQRDIEMSSYGLSTSDSALGCSIRSLKFNAGNGGNRVLAPVVITDGASNGPDTLRVLSTAGVNFSVPLRVTTAHGVTTTAADAQFGVSNSIGVSAGDLMLAIPQTPSATNTCTIFRVNGTLTNSIIGHSAGAGDTLNWNGTSATPLQDLMAIFPATGYPIGSFLVNLGPGLMDRTYSISAGSLQVVDFDNSTATNLAAREVAPQIVNLQALYGKDTNADGAIDLYDAVTPTDNAGWRQVLAIRVALVSRSALQEKDSVTASAPVWNLGATPTVTGATACGNSQCLPLRVNSDMQSGWERYRYKVFDMVIPLRNRRWKS